LAGLHLLELLAVYLEQLREQDLRAPHQQELQAQGLYPFYAKRL
jgi:hypothetical protein